MKQLIIFAAFIFLGSITQAQSLIQGTIKNGTAANSIDVWVKPNFNNVNSQYIYQYQFPIGFPSTTNPQPTGLTVTLDPAFATGEYTVTVYAKGVSGAFNYYVISLVRTLSTNQSWTSGTEFRMCTATFTSGTNSTPPSSIASLIDDQASGSDGQCNFYAVSGTTYYVTANSAGNFYAVAGASTIGGTSSNGFAQTANPVVLPVTLIDFTAAKSSEACAINLKWQATAEVNFKNYEVQRSTTNNGLNYTTIATIAAQGVRNYTSTDASPVSGVNYYRLKMNDFDGHFSYSKIIPINSNCNGTIIQVWPNPAVNTVNVTGLTGKNNLVVIDAIGKQVATFTTTNIFQKINMGKFSRGNYTIMITSADGAVTTLKLIKI